MPEKVLELKRAMEKEGEQYPSLRSYDVSAGTALQSSFKAHTLALSFKRVVRNNYCKLSLPNAIYNMFL